MSFINKDILIEDWMGTQLYLGPYDDDRVDQVLDANRCHYCAAFKYCAECDNTGYIGDFIVMWIDESDKDDCNVYDYINY